MKSQMFTDGFELIQQADVTTEVDTSLGLKHQRLVAKIGDYTHTFKETSRVSNALQSTDKDSLANKLSGGNFFFKDGELITFQYGTNLAFVHSNESIQSLIDHVGYTVDQTGSNFNNQNLQSQSIRLQQVHSNVEVEGLSFGQEGGDLNSQLSFVWSPFQSFVGTAYKVIRLICLNGMTGTSSILNQKIPMVNNWREHLEIASKQIQNKVTNKLTNRLEYMTKTHATVRDCQRIVDLCEDRLDEGENYFRESTRKILTDNIVIANPELNLADHYKPQVFTDRSIADQAKSHLSMFTVWNMLTEIATHTTSGKNISTAGVHKHANDILFGRSENLNSTNVGEIKLSSVFNNVESALVGDQL